jgi:hypothetical protein
VRYEPYMPWSCDICGRRGDVIVPNDSDCHDRVRLVDESHAMMAEGECPGGWRVPGLRTGPIVNPEAPSVRRRRIPWRH